MSGPNSFVLIIGGMKCGTTSLFDILRQHSEICASKVKEPDFFIKNSGWDNKQDYLKLWKWNADLHRIAMEASVSYTKYPFFSDVPKRISSTDFGRYKFIYILRDPLSRIESQARHALFAGWGKSLDEELSEDLIAYSNYGLQLEQYLEYFSTNDIYAFTLEEFRQTPHEVLKRICGFLGVDQDYEFSEVETPRNTGEFFNTPPAVAQITQSKFGEKIKKYLLSERLKNYLRQLLSRVWKNRNARDRVGRWRLTEVEKVKIFGLV